MKFKAVAGGWAINGRGKRINCPAYDVMDGAVVGHISSVLGSGGGRGWNVDSPPNCGRGHYTRRDAAKAIQNYLDRTRAAKGEQ